MQQQQRRRTQSGRKNERGAALIVAVSMLLLFAALGAAYMKFGFLEIDETNYGVRDVRARQLAEAGVQAALGKLEAGLRQGDVLAALGGATYTFPSYRAASGTEAPTLTEMDESAAQVEVYVTDESGKVNLNHAPASVLQRVLGVDGATARAITASLPRTDGAGADGARWLLHPDELVSRKLLTPEQYAAVDTSKITTFTVINHAQPEPHFSVNMAQPDVLAAMLGIPVEQAQQIKGKGPYASMEALAQAAGGTVDALVPAESRSNFLIESNTFNIVSTATYQADNGAISTAQVSAIVRLTEDGYTTLSWNVTRPETVAPAAADPQTEEAGDAAPQEDAPAETEVDSGEETAGESAGVDASAA